MVGAVGAEHPIVSYSLHFHWLLTSVMVFHLLQKKKKKRRLFDEELEECSLVGLGIHT